MPRLVVLALCVLILGCQKDAGITTPSTPSGAVHVGLRAQVAAPAGSTLDLRVVYFDKAGALDTAVVLADSQFTIDTGAQHLSLSVNVANCLLDNARVNPSSTACALAVVARLLTNGVITDSVMLPPMPTAPGGTLMDSTALSLSNFKTWVGGAAGAPTDWSNAANWSPASVPVAGSWVILNGSAASPPTNMPVLSQSVTVRDVSLNGFGTDIKVNGHHLTVTGSMGVGGGTLTMTNASDTVTVDSIQFLPGFGLGSSNPTGHNTAGVLQVGARFIAYTGAFVPQGTLQFVATGSGVWEADTIPVLTVTGAGTTVTFIKTTGQSAPEVTVGTLTLANGATIAPYGGFAPTLAVITAVNTVAGTNFAPASVTLYNGAALNGVKGAYNATTTIIDPQGTKTVTINPINYQRLILRGGAIGSFAGATTFSGASPQLWIDSSSTVTNTQTLTFTNTNTSDTVIRTTNGGTFASLSASSIVNAPVGRVMLFGGSESGLLTAGTWTVGNGFSGNALSGTGTFHLVVAGGTSAAPAQVFADTLSSVTLTNNAFADIVGLTGTTAFPTVINTLSLTNGATLGSSPTSTQVTLVGAFSGAAGTTVASGTFTMLSATGLTSAGTFSPYEVYFHPSTPALTLPGGISPTFLWIRGSAQAKLGASINPVALLVDSTSNLDLNGHTVRAGASGVTTLNGGTITMAAASDTLNVGGGANFGGGNETGLLAAGVLNIGASTLSTSGGTSFVSSGTLQTVCGSPTAGGALLYGQFQSLQVVNHCAVEATTLAGSFISLAGTSGAPVLQAGPISIGPLTAANFNVTALVDSNVPLILTGTVTAFQNVTFEGFPPTQTQLSMTLAPGTVVTLSNVTFQALLSTDTGSYLDVTNSGGVGGAAVTINVSHDPGNGAAKTLTSGNVTVNWSP